jgi:hypothetical protein
MVRGLAARDSAVLALDWWTVCVQSRLPARSRKHAPNASRGWRPGRPWQWSIQTTAPGSSDQATFGERTVRSTRTGVLSNRDDQFYCPAQTQQFLFEHRVALDIPECLKPRLGHGSLLINPEVLRQSFNDDLAEGNPPSRGKRFRLPQQCVRQFHGCLHGQRVHPER